MRVVFVPLLEDNYAYLIIDEASGVAGIIDPAEAGPVLAAVAREKVRLVSVLNTHHHPDHSGGNLDLLRAVPGLEVVGSAADAPRIPGLTRAVSGGDRVRVGGLEGRVLFVPCHTRGHVAFLFDRCLFSGDTLFAGGCGRFFEGTAADMDHALREVLGALPDDTQVYCGHEYTEKNLAFARTLEPDNQVLAAKADAVRALRAAGRPSLPTTIGEERAYNPFLRTTVPALADAVARRVTGVDPKDPVQVLAAVRKLKDTF